VKSITQQEGVKGLYKGMASPLAGVAAINRYIVIMSLLFAVYGSALRMVSRNPDTPTVRDVFLAGSISGFVNAFFSTPMELGIRV
jgi:solute carrier family 25 carnitine/acylcarnitine transporter 20/29